MKNEHERQEGENFMKYQSRVSVAWRTGTKIQSRCVEDKKGPWRDVPKWSPDTFLYWGRYDYRIAPGQQEKEPAKAREWWIVPASNWQERGAVLDHPSIFYTRVAECVHVREVMPGDDVDALRAELAQMDADRCAAIADATAAYSERNAAEQARDNALSAVRDMRAELDQMTAERNAVIRDCVNEQHKVRSLQALLDRINRDAASADFAAKREEMTELLHAKDRIIALQDELAASRNETATLAAKLTEVTR